MAIDKATLSVAVAAAIVLVLIGAEITLNGPGSDDVTWNDLMSIDKDAAETAKSLDDGGPVKIRNVTAFALLRAGVPQELMSDYPFDWNMMAKNTGLTDGVGKGPDDRAQTRDLNRVLRNSEPLAKAFEGGISEPFFHDGLPQPVFAYTPVESADYTNLDSDTIRYVVYVETGYDTDSDGKRDLIEVYLQIPRAAVEGGYKAPVILIANPYDHGPSVKEEVGPEDGYDMSRIYSQPDARTPGGSVSAYDAAMAAKPSDWHYDYKGHEYQREHYIDYFLVRGYAVAFCGVLGSYGSEGYVCSGMDLELMAVKDVIEWFDGDSVGYTSKDSLVTTGADWCSGSVGMYGISYLGTLQLGVAAMGIDNLKTVVPASAISDWYEYVYQKGGCINPDTINPYMVDMSEFISTAMDPLVGDYNDFLQKVSYDEYVLQGQYTDGTSEFWKDRDYTLMDVETGTSMMLIHGINDYNVRMVELAKTLGMFGDAGITMKVFLHQGAHQVSYNGLIFGMGDDDGMVAVNKWMSHYLFGKDTGVEDWPDIQVQSNIDGSWSAYESLDPTSEVRYTSTAAGTDTFYSDTQEDIGIEIEIQKADKDMTVVGGEVRLRLKSDSAVAPNQPVSVIVYDRCESGMKAYHNSSQSQVDTEYVTSEDPEECTVWFGSTIQDQKLSRFALKDTTSREFDKGAVGLGYYGETVDLESMRVQDREPGKYYDYVIDLLPTAYTLKAGHSIVVYITAYDPEMVSSLQGKLFHYDVTVDLSSVELVLDLA